MHLIASIFNYFYALIFSINNIIHDNQPTLASHNAKLMHSFEKIIFAYEKQISTLKTMFLFCKTKTTQYTPLKIIL